MDMVAEGDVEQRGNEHSVADDGQAEGEPVLFERELCEAGSGCVFGGEGRLCAGRNPPTPGVFETVRQIGSFPTTTTTLLQREQRWDSGSGRYPLARDQPSRRS